MKKKTQPLAPAIIIAAFLLTALAIPSDCFGFQFSMKSSRATSFRTGSSHHRTYQHHTNNTHRHSPRYRRFTSPMLKPPASKPFVPKPLAFKPLALKPFAFKTQHLQLGIFSLPYYGSHPDAVLSQSAKFAPDYPSNITAYDAEFRGQLPSQSPIDSNTISIATPWESSSPATSVIESSSEIVIGSHAHAALQTAGSSHFDLQQRLLESREVPSIRSATAASNLQGHAETAFQEGRYYDAAYYSDLATKADPHNGLIYLFSSQCHFAIQKYSVAILMLEHATTKLPESQWGYVVEHYDTFYGRNDYVAHTQALANYLRRRPDDNRARTLLGYLYGCLGHKTTASRLFHQSLQTYRNDELAQRLIPIFGDPTFASTVVKSVDAPTPELLDGPIMGEPTYLSSTGNPLIFLTPGPSVTGPPPSLRSLRSPQSQQSPSPRSLENSSDASMEELPSPEELFFDENQIELDLQLDQPSILLPPLNGPSELE